MPTRHRSAVLLLALAAGSTAHAESTRDLAARLRADTAVRSELSLLSARPIPLRATILLQTRYMVSRRTADVVGSRDRHTIGFSIPRAEIRLDANIFNDQLTAHVSFDFGDAEGDRGRGAEPTSPAGGGEPQLRQAYAQYNFGGEQTGYYFKAGQWRSNLITEEAIAPEYQMAVERSVANEFFAPGNTQGIALGRVDDRFAWEVSFNDGIRYLGQPEPSNTAFDSRFEADYALSGRFDWKLAGDWTRFEDLASWRGSNEAIRVGVGAHIQRQGDTNPGLTQPDFLLGDTEDATTALWAVDAQYESDGWSVYAGYMGHYIEWDFPDQVLRVTQHGWVLQGAMFTTDQIELFARYDGIRLDGNLTGSDAFNTGQQMHHFLTAGFNYYLIPESHACRFTFDVVAALSDAVSLSAGAPNANSIFFPDPTVTGLMGDASEEFVFRAQMQFLF